MQRTCFALTALLTVSALQTPARAGVTSNPPIGQVYTLTNASASNEVAVFDRLADGAVDFSHMAPTGGFGTGATLGNQGAVVLTDDDRFLLAVNAGSNDLSVFRVLSDGLRLVEIEPSGGVTPVSVTVHDDVVYVVHAGSNGIAGFRIGFDGDLTPLPRSVARLSGPGTAPAQIEFGPRGQFLYATEKATNIIARFRVDETGNLVERSVTQANNATPFGFAFGRRGQLFMSEAAMGAEGASTVSAFVQGSGGDLLPVTVSAPTTQTAACWIAVTPDGRTVFASNTGSDSISSFRVGFNGGLELLDAQAANTAPSPLDMAITRDGRFFYVLDEGAGLIGDYTIDASGALTGLPGSQMVLPTGASGLAVR